MKCPPYLMTGALCLFVAYPTFADTEHLPKEVSTASTTRLSTATLSEDDMHYVRLECEGFAKEDQITDEQLENYLETCVSELSAAVESAIKNLQNSLDSPKTNKNQTS